MSNELKIQLLRRACCNTIFAGCVEPYCVEWLISQLKISTYWNTLIAELELVDLEIDDIIEQAKSMHKEEKKQVLKDYFAWHKSKGFVSHKKEDIEEFINETFGGNNEQQ